jgi:hypothetical protein
VQRIQQVCNLTHLPSGADSVYDFVWPGDFATHARFFVFTGVVSWLFCSAR